MIRRLTGSLDHTALGSERSLTAMLLPTGAGILASFDDTRWRLLLEDLADAREEDIRRYLELLGASDDVPLCDHLWDARVARAAAPRFGFGDPATLVSSAPVRDSGLIGAPGLIKRSSSTLVVQHLEHGHLAGWSAIPPRSLSRLEADEPIIVRGLATRSIVPRVAAPVAPIAAGSTPKISPTESKVAAPEPFVLQADRPLRVRGRERPSGIRGLQAAAALAAIVILSTLVVARAPLFGGAGMVSAQSGQPGHARIVPWEASLAALSPLLSHANAGVRPASVRLIAERAPAWEPSGDPPAMWSGLTIKRRGATAVADEPAIVRPMATAARWVVDPVNEASATAMRGDVAAHALQPTPVSGAQVPAKTANRGTKPRVHGKTARKPTMLATALGERSGSPPVLPDTLRPH